MSRFFRSSAISKGKQPAQLPCQEPPRPQQQPIYPQQQPRGAHGRGNVGIGVAGGNQVPSAHNPQSGASYSSSSRGTQSSDDGVAVAINLTEQRLMDWTNDTRPTTKATGGATLTTGKSVTFPHTYQQPNPQRRNIAPSSSKGVTNLILLIEQSNWVAASQRALTHPHEVKQLVKLRKTTKSTSSGSSMGGVQISNVKCKALHHACQKLRSVHTNIYTNHDKEGNWEDDTMSVEGGRVVDQDEYIEACKCILTLIQLHPEACKERESRHGCLPLHLAVFSMCATPPPPDPNGRNEMESSLEQSTDEKTHSRISSDSNYTSLSQKPPTISSRSNSVPVKMTVSKGHRVSNSSSSADFSMGNISTMIQEESEHQQALDQHQQSVKAANEEGKSKGDTLEDKLLSRMDEMESMLRDLENEYNRSRGKKNKQSKREAVSPTAVGMCSGDSDVLDSFETKNHTETTTKVVGVSMPMDSLDELSRETDSLATPLNEQSHHVEYNDPPAEQKIPSYASSCFTTQVGNLSKAISSKFSNVKSAIQSSNTSIASNRSNHYTANDYEELKRRYLQINTKRREEYSLRVINALLDAWPRGVKTSSEGGRLPLHMACFGKATVKVMEAILNSYPDAARQRNADGFLPIHIAAHWGVSHPDIAPLLLRAYPDGAVGRNRWERTPIEEALGMAGENGREHQMSLVWALRRHPTYWIHNDIATMLLPRNARNAPWRLVDAGESVASSLPSPTSNSMYSLRYSGGGAVDVDEVGSSDDDEGFEVKAPQASPPSSATVDDPQRTLALAESINLSVLITKEKHWDAAAIRCLRHPHEAREALEVKVRGAYTAKITPLHYACEQNPTVEVIRALVSADPSALRRRQEPGGQLPLHAACTWGASVDVIRVLLSACPDSAEACDFLSNLPLHCACYSGSETLVVKALLKIYPQSVWPRNHQGSSALDIARRLGHPNRKEVVGLLEGTMNQLLTSKLAQGDWSTSTEALESAEANRDNGLMWV
eukprot:CCRYP_008829-RD/>CCRYP_008829-RD protein AED:0.09 eAED:0.09 QI:2581/1/1/1/0.57/0.5/8/904/1000